MSIKPINEWQAANLRNLLKNGAFQFIDDRTPWFPYTSGQIGPYYVQSIAIERDGAAYAAAIQSLADLIRASGLMFDAISGGETRDWDFSNPVAVTMQTPHVKLYKDGKVLGAEIAGKSILHVADLNNEGSSVRDYWKPILERHGGRLIGFCAFVDRLEEGVPVLRGLGLEPRSVVPLDEAAWDLACQDGYVSPAIRDILVARQRDPRGWATQALQDHPRLFQTLYQNPQTQAKALKIIQTYPEIADYLHRLAAG